MKQKRTVSWPGGVPVVFGKRVVKKPAPSQDAQSAPHATSKGGSLKSLIAHFLNRPRREPPEPVPVPAQPRLPRKRTMAELRAQLRN